MHGETVGARRLPLPRSSSSSAAQFLPPAVPGNQVGRPRLLDLLDESTQAPLTLVVAPAGAGKTSLLASWCERREPQPTRWLSVEDTDGSRQQFWAALTAAVHHMVRDPEDPQAEAVHEHEATIEGLSDVLMAAESRHPEGAVLVIDDLQFLEGEGHGATSLEQLLRVLPDWLHLLVSSRHMPALPIDRLRARGQLAEVLFDELRFTTCESVEVVARVAPWLSPEEAASTAERADGWAAGIQLSGLGARAARAQGRDARAAGRTDLMVTDFVWREVLAHESAELVQVLLDVSVVTALSSALAATLADRDDAHRLLGEAETRGLFVWRVEGEDRLEIHDLVRRALLVEARRRDPDRVRDRHVRAARWFQERGDVEDVAIALHHWLAAGEHRLALRCLAGNVTALYDSGREETISTVLASIPDVAARGDLDAQVDLAWCQLLVDKAAFLDEVRDAAVAAGHGVVSPTTQGRVRMLQSIGATLTGSWSDGGQQSLEALQHLGPSGWADPLGRFGWNMVARDLALSESWDDEAPSLQDARSAVGRDPERRMSFEGIGALGCALAGRPLDALRMAAGLSGYARVRSMSILRVELAVAEALAHRELGDRERARAELCAVLAGPVGPVTHAKALAHLELVEMCLDQADLEGARKQFGEAEVFVRTEFAGADGLSWLARRGVLVALASGDLESAEQWNARVEDKFWSGVGRARLLLQRGELVEAAEELGMVTPRCPRHEVVRGLLLARAVPSGQQDAELYASIVTMAVETGMMQTVASAGPHILDALEQHPWLAPDPWLARVHHAVPPSRRAGVTQITLPGEHLTDRELGVLRMLPSRLTVREIGEELGISVNTVKFHLRVIYRKLGVSSRNEAAAMARSLRRVGHELPR